MYRMYPKTIISRNKDTKGETPTNSIVEYIIDNYFGIILMWGHFMIPGVFTDNDKATCLTNYSAISAALKDD